MSVLDTLNELVYCEASSTILDIDLDFFLDQSGKPVFPAHILGKLLSRNWRGVGIALSPNYCGGLEHALAYLRAAFIEGQIPLEDCLCSLFDMN